MNTVTYRHIIEDQLFTGEDCGLIIRDNTLIKNCTFKGFIGKNMDAIQIWGPDTVVTISNCIFDQTGINPDDYDEAVSIILGANVTIIDCSFINIGKTILAGNGDYPDDPRERELKLKIKNTVFIGCSRRNPYLRYGKLMMDNCLLDNWGKTLYVKSHGIRLGEHAEGVITNTRFIMDKFCQNGFREFLHDWKYQLTGEMWGLDPDKTNHYIPKLIFKMITHPIQAIKACLPGPMKGIYCENGSKVSISNCKKNHWWIRFLK